MQKRQAGGCKERHSSGCQKYRQVAVKRQEGGVIRQAIGSKESDNGVGKDMQKEGVK